MRTAKYAKYKMRMNREIREKNADAKGFQNLTTEKIQNTRKECKYGEQRTAKYAKYAKKIQIQRDAKEEKG